MIEPDLIHSVLYNIDEILQEENWYLKPHISHRIDGPAHITYHPNGNKRYEAWYINGELHRNPNPDGSIDPAEIWYDIDENIIEIQYYEHDYTHRLDGPAYIQYHPNGNKIYEAWYQNGERHNLNGPAIVKYDVNGNKNYEAWCQNDEIHNLNGPAIVKYDDNGKVIHESWWEYGIEILKG